MDQHGETYIFPDEQTIVQALKDEPQMNDSGERYEDVIKKLACYFAKQTKVRPGVYLGIHLVLYDLKLGLNETATSALVAHCAKALIQCASVQGCTAPMMQ